MKTFNCKRLFALLWLFAWSTLIVVANPGYSPNITVDTRGDTGVDVYGRVLDSETKAPLAGVTLTLTGRSGVSAADGSFRFGNVELEKEGSVLIISAEDYLTDTLTVTATKGQEALNLGDIFMVPVGEDPEVTSVNFPEGYYVPGWGLQIPVTARVNWNGNTPQNVTFSANGVVVRSVSGPGPEYQATFSVDAHFIPSTTPGANYISVVATGIPTADPKTPVDSKRQERQVVVLPWPAALLLEHKTTHDLELSAKFSWPKPKLSGEFPLPIFKNISGEIGIVGEFSYSIRSGEWEFTAGAEFDDVEASSFRFKVGPLSPDNISGEVKFKAEGTATLTNGFGPIAVGGLVSVAGDYPIGSYTPLGLMGPGLTSEWLGIPMVGEVFQAMSVILWLRPGIDGEYLYQVLPNPGFKQATIAGKAALDAAYEPEIGETQAEFYVGGEPSITFGLPGDFFKSVNFRCYAGVKTKVYSWEFAREFIILDVSLPSQAISASLASRFYSDDGSRVLEAADNAIATWQFMPRPWREGGAEIFSPAMEGRLIEDEGVLPVETRGSDDFALMGTSVSVGKTNKTGATASRIVSNGQGAPVEAAFPLISNVFPDSAPALTAKGNELMLAYVRDTGAANPVQFTEIAFSHFDGTNWSAPSPIGTDARGQFGPKVVFDGAGNAVVVFERMKDGAFAENVMEDMFALMEIVWSRWDAVTKTWSVPQALTNNAFLDFSPELSGPLTDGDLLLTWKQSESNELDGTGAPGAATNLQVMTRRWDSATQTWGTEVALVPNLTGELSESLASRGNKGVYVWSVDADGNMEDSNDAELFYRIYSTTTGEWGPITRHTHDEVKDNHVHAVVDAAGNVYTVWNRNGDLVMDVNFNGMPSMVREGDEGLGVADFALTIGPGGNLALIWQEMGENGPNAHYRVYDPLSSTWGQDSFLSQDSDLERSFAPVWDSAGNLTLAYNNVQITKVTKNVVVEGGATVTVDGVPQPGRVDLMLAKRSLVKDLAAVPEGLTADGTTFLPGDALTLKARVKNSGNLAVENVQVAFYDGDPANGGTLIGTATVPGWLEAATEAEVTLNWTVPEPESARTIHVKIDPADAVPESDEGNNALALPINGVDLELEYQSGSVLRDGSARVIVRVKNLSAPASPVTTLRLKSLETEELLAVTTIKELAPGRFLDVPIDLPPGTQGVGDRSYKMTIDEEDLSLDIDRDNNDILFSLNLPLDESGGFKSSEVAALKALAKNFVVGQTVDLDLSFLSTTGAEKLLMLGLPKGLTFNPVTKRLTGTVLGLLGETPVEIRVLNGKVIERAILFNLSVSPHPFQGAYTALLETTDPEPLPTGLIKVMVTSTGAYTATLNLIGQGVRSAKGSFTTSAGASQQAISLVFPAGRNDVPSATTIQMTLPAGGSSDLVTGTRDGGSEILRGFRLAQSAKVPGTTQKFTVAMTDSAPGDGTDVPAGTGTLTGTVDSKGVVKLAGFTGDAQALTASFSLSQTHQAVFWMQPYKSKESYLGGVVTIGNWGLADRAVAAESLTEGLKWFKQADATEKAYPSGFGARTLEARANRWVVPSTALSMAGSLGLEFSEVGVDFGNPLGLVGLPSRFRLSDRYAMIRIAPNTAVPWVGRAQAASGSFSGSLTLTNGTGAVNGVFLQETATGASVGTGLVRVLLPESPTTPKGSFQTSAMDLVANQGDEMTDGTGGFSDIEEAALNALGKRFVVGQTVDLDLSFLSTTGVEKLLMFGLPKGLTFNPVTKRLTGTIVGLLGETPVEIRVLNGKVIERAILFNLSVSPHPFQGAYTALLETTDTEPLPTGQIKVLITSTGAYTATLNLAGQTTRSAKGSFPATTGATQQTINIPFLAGKNSVPPATTIQMTLPALYQSDLVTGSRDSGSETLRGFRLAQSVRIPGPTQKFTLAMINLLPGDGVQVPAGTGTLTGTVDNKGLVKLAGFTGDAQTVTASFDLSQTHQAVFWAQPYKNKASYLGGIMTMGNLGLADRAKSAESLTAGLRWYKQADGTEKAYPSGFSAQSLEARASNWIAPASSMAMAASLGLESSEIDVSYGNPLAVVALPSRFRLSEKYALMRIAPNAALPWQGKATSTSGVFTGNVTLPNGAGGVNGVFLQEGSFGASVGAGLVRVPLPVGPTTPKGSFQTIGIELSK